MKECFLARGYPEIVVNNETDKVVFGGDQTVRKNLEGGIPLVTTYHPKVKEFEKLISDLLPFLCSDGEVQNAFSPSPIVSYRSAKNKRLYSEIYVVSC